jgi:hypothetical protein
VCKCGTPEGGSKFVFEDTFGSQVQPTGTPAQEL